MNWLDFLKALVSLPWAPVPFETHDGDLATNGPIWWAQF